MSQKREWSSNWVKAQLDARPIRGKKGLQSSRAIKKKCKARTAVEVSEVYHSVRKHKHGLYIIIN